MANLYFFRTRHMQSLLACVCVFALSFVFFPVVCGAEHLRCDAGGLASFVDGALGRHRVPAAAVALILPGSDPVVVVRGAGVTEHTLWQVASVSKPVAAWGAMSLVNDGVVALNAPVSKYVSRWSLPRGPHSRHQSLVTLRSLLSHTAGLTVRGYPGFPPEVQLPSLEESLSGAANDTPPVVLKHKPGLEFHYSGGGYTLMQLLIEETSGTPFATFLHDRVLEPLGMTHSTFDPTPTQLERVAPAHTRWFGYFIQRVPNFRYTATAAAGLHSTAGDLAKFVVANLKAYAEPESSLDGKDVAAGEDGISAAEPGASDTEIKPSMRTVSQSKDDSVDSSITNAASSSSNIGDGRVTSVSGSGDSATHTSEKCTLMTEDGACGDEATAGDTVDDVGEHEFGAADGNQNSLAVDSRESHDTAPLPASIIRLMHTPLRVKFGSRAYGLGFDLERLAGLRMIGHSGKNRGWTSQMYFSKKFGSGLVVLTNSDGGDGFVSDAVCFWAACAGIDKLRIRCEKMRNSERVQFRIAVVTFAVCVAFFVFLYRKNSRFVANARIAASASDKTEKKD